MLYRSAANDVACPALIESGWSVLPSSALFAPRIRSPDDLPELAADYDPTGNDWYCSSKHATIQFLRSSIAGEIIRDGPFAISTRVAVCGKREPLSRR
jgi:hypothetical protein